MFTYKKYQISFNSKIKCSNSNRIKDADFSLFNISTFESSIWFLSDMWLALKFQEINRLSAAETKLLNTRKIDPWCQILTQTDWCQKGTEHRSQNINKKKQKVKRQSLNHIKIPRKHTKRNHILTWISLVLNLRTFFKEIRCVVWIHRCWTLVFIG